MDAMRDLIRAAWSAEQAEFSASGLADSSAGTETAVGVSGLAGFSTSGLADSLAGTEAAESTGLADFERRVMLAVARAESDRLRRRAQWTALAAAACLVGLLLTLPVDALIDSIGNTAKELTTISMHH